MSRIYLDSGDYFILINGNPNRLMVGKIGFYDLRIYGFYLMA